MKPPAGGRADIDRSPFLGGLVTLQQPRTGHRVGTDAALVIAAARAHARGHVIDVGAGVGAIGLALATLAPATRVTLVEIDPALAGLAARNAASNGLAERVTVVTADIGDLAWRSGVAPADIVVMNPPFLDTARVRRSPDVGRGRAHVMEEGGLHRWLGAAAALLAQRGGLVLIHRPDGLAGLLAGLAADFGSVVLRAVHPRAGREATRILVFAKKGGRAALSIAPPLILHDGPEFTPLAEAVHRGEAALPFD